MLIAQPLCGKEHNSSCELGDWLSQEIKLLSVARDQEERRDLAYMVSRTPLSWDKRLTMVSAS